jgi:hypothetical protein
MKCEKHNEWKVSLFGGDPSCVSCWRDHQRERAERYEPKMPAPQWRDLTPDEVEYAKERLRQDELSRGIIQHNARGMAPGSAVQKPELENELGR